MEKVSRRKRMMRGGQSYSSRQVEDYIFLSRLSSGELEHALTKRERELGAQTVI